jgi:hypothetical protein
MTLAWEDAALPLETDALLPLIVDLDLVVVAPGGARTFGNMRVDEDSHSTVEKVVIENAPPGTYEIRIIANPSISPTAVRFALVVNGPFPHADFVRNPPDLSAANASAGFGKCDPLRAGTFCQVTVSELHQGEPISLAMQPRAYEHFRLVAPAGGFEDPITIESDIRSQQVGILRLVLNKDNMYKLSLPRWLAGFQIESEDVPISVAGENVDVLYFSVFADFWEPIEYRIKWKVPGESDGSNWDFVLVPLVICVVLIVVIIVGVGVVVWRRYGADEQTAVDELRTGEPSLLEDIQDHPEIPAPNV